LHRVFLLCSLLTRHFLLLSPPFSPATPFSPASGPVTGSFNGLHPKSNSLAVDETEEAIEQAIALQAIIQGIDNYGDIMALVGVKNLAELGEGLAGLSTDEVDVLTSQALEITISTNSTADDFRKVIIRLTVEYSTYDSDCCEETQTEDSESGPYKNAREAERKVKDEERKAIKSICK
jgi:hypothetical protein